MEQEIPKTYTAKDWEEKLYHRWKESGFFNPDICIEKGVTKEDAPPFSVLMPPPNVTGILHLGHALENSIMDVMARYKRMQGFRTLFLPGTDHAAVATQARVEKNLIETGIQNPRQELGREKLLTEIRKFSEASKKTILAQIASLGSSCDWSRLVYTFDEQRSRTVNVVFKKMFDDGLIYKGYKVVNWSVKGQSTCSDDELVSIERSAKLYTMRYSKDFPIPIATTRPETKLGDTAVAVHPDDERYKKYIGQIFTVAVGAKDPLHIKIIADENVIPEFGTGAVGVTPAHSQVDFEMFERDTTIGLIPVIGIDGRMNENAGQAYSGLTTEEAREKFVLWLRENDLLEKEEDIVQNIGTSDRFGDVVEALPLNQWFVNVNKHIPGRTASLKDLMREAVTTGHGGDGKKRISIQPEHFERIYLHWIDNLRDWCISRQIWWGHRIPVWYKGTETYCGIEAPTGEGWEQDPDTLDTWFSSGMWSFSTLGWPENSEDLERYHPTSFMQMGHEILFFWMARMILMTTYTLDTIPFRNVYIHGMVLDQDGRKFSKSLGNGIDPLEVTGEYGTDALRVALLSDIAPGNDSRFSMEKVEVARNFVNKLWNITRYTLATTDENSSPQPNSPADEWILSRLNKTVGEVTKHLDNYHFSLALEKLREFTWSEFADWYVEIHKVEKNDVVLRLVLDTVIRLWHPFIPFVTEAVFQTLYPHKDSLLMVENWPQEKVSPTGSRNAERFVLVIGVIKEIRSLRKIYNISPAHPLAVSVAKGVMEKTLILDNEATFKRLARISDVHIIDTADIPKHCILVQSGPVQAFLELEGVIDFDIEKKRLKKEKQEKEKYIATLETTLSNKNFIERAKPEIVEAERLKREGAKKELADLSRHLSTLL